MGPEGVFGNETNPADWKFYENLGQNRFKPIDRSQFEVRILKRGIVKTLDNFVRSLFRIVSALVGCLLLIVGVRNKMLLAINDPDS